MSEEEKHSNDNVESRAYDNMCYLVDKFAPWSDSDSDSESSENCTASGVAS